LGDGAFDDVAGKLYRVSPASWAGMLVAMKLRETGAVMMAALETLE
jgi:hypothetical protein